jgi:hypothetical protein
VANRIVTIAAEAAGAHDFVVEPNREQLLEVAWLVDAGELWPESIRCSHLPRPGRHLCATQPGANTARSCLVSSGSQAQGDDLGRAAQRHDPRPPVEDLTRSMRVNHDDAVAACWPTWPPTTPAAPACSATARPRLASTGSPGAGRTPSCSHSAHASWLNQIEIYFSVVQRKAVAPNDFTDLDQLRQRLADFQQRYNAAARPLGWTVTPS